MICENQTSLQGLLRHTLDAWAAAAGFRTQYLAFTHEKAGITKYERGGNG